MDTVASTVLASIMVLMSPVLSVEVSDFLPDSDPTTLPQNLNSVSLKTDLKSYQTDYSAQH